MELLYTERSVVIRNKGSIEFSEEEQSSDIVLVDVKCDAINGTTYYNTKTLPPYGFYGSVTLFGGATVRKRIALEFVYQRVVDFEADYRRLRCYLTKLEDMLQTIGNAVTAPVGVPPVGDGEPRDSFEYRGLPYSKIKINSERLAQYTVVVRSYKEQDIQCQSVNKSDDPTTGEDEYPVPLPIPANGEFPPSLPAPDGPYPGGDDRDFPDIDPNQPWTPKTMYFGFRGLFTTGQVGAPNACTADTPFNLNYAWENAGPPPYTIRLGDGIPPNCTNSRWGFHVMDDLGGQSPLYAGLAGTISAEIVVFDDAPF